MLMAHYSCTKGALRLIKNILENKPLHTIGTTFPARQFSLYYFDLLLD